MREEGDETVLKRANKTYVIFDLVSADGYSQHFEFRVSDLEKEMERDDSPYVAIMTLCEAQAPASASPSTSALAPSPRPGDASRGRVALTD